jgi:hypothetical protein
VNIRFAAIAMLLLALGVQTVTAGFLVGLVRNRPALPSNGASARPAEDAAVAPREDEAA